MTEWTADDLPRMDDRTVVVTGANSGIGLAATRAFARAGATVVMACRDVGRGDDAAGDVRADVPDADLDVRACDLADLGGVATFADGVCRDYEALDVLCNNAGVMAVPYRETADGFEYQFGVNHLGHFALTGRLLDRLVAAPDARVVTQSSGMHERGDLDPDAVAGHGGSGPEASYDRWDAYARSKLANVLFAYELDRRVAGVTSVACHPGYAATELQYRGPRATGSRLRLLAMRAANALFAQSPERGALPMLRAATDPAVAGATYWGPSGPLGMRGPPAEGRSSDRSYDQGLARRLWEVSADLTGVAYGDAGTAAGGTPGADAKRADADAT
ncbi:MAG: oxidoreductase [Haloferacaceae archaeon]